MELTRDLVFNAMRALDAQFISYKKAEKLASILGSREEFLAWLLLKEQVNDLKTEIMSEVREVAKFGAARAETTRVAYMIDPSEDLAALEAALRDLLAAESAVDQPMKNIHQSCVSLAKIVPEKSALRALVVQSQ